MSKYSTRLFFTLFLTLSVHTAAITWLHGSKLHLSSISRQNTLSLTLPEEEEIQKTIDQNNSFLKEAFNTIATPIPSPSPNDIRESSPPIADITPFSSPSTTPDLAISSNKVLPQLTQPLAITPPTPIKDPNISLFEGQPLFQNEQTNSDSLATQLLQATQPTPAPTPQKTLQQTLLPFTLSSLLANSSPLFQVTQTQPRPNTENSKELLLQNNQELFGTIAGSDDFFSQVTFLPRKGEKGYLFKIVLRPKARVKFRRIKQNVFFLIDRSHSINKNRYVIFKSAVTQVLQSMHPEDTFNILIFDDQVVKLSQNSLNQSPKNFRRAQEFLNKQPHGGIFASTDLYASLDKIIPIAVAENEINTAILFSDGDTYLEPKLQRKTIYEWTRKNAGKISLFTFAAGSGNNLPLLELLSSFNKGFATYSASEEKIPHTLKKMMQHIGNPIGKNIVLTVIPKNPKRKIHLYPRSNRLPNLYEHLPYEIFGSIDKLDDFYLFLQGRYYNTWLDIKQEINFSRATESRLDLEAIWTTHQVYDHYDRFLREGNRQHLIAAQKLLKSINKPQAFR